MERRIGVFMIWSGTSKLWRGDGRFAGTLPIPIIPFTNLSKCPFLFFPVIIVGW